MALHRMLTVYCLTQVTEGTDGESMEAVSEPGASGDVGDPELDRGASPRLSEHGEDEHFVAEKEMESKEIEHKETEAAAVPSLGSVSPQNQSPPQSSFSTEETVSTVLVQAGEPGITSETKKEGSEGKTEEDFELNKENVAVKDKSLEESAVGPDVSEETHMDKISDRKKEITNTIEKMDPDVGTQQEKESLGCNLKVSTADDLDEMMDIGTVDQVEQEALMKEEEQNSLMDVDSSQSSAISNTGMVKQIFCFSQ